MVRADGTVSVKRQTAKQSIKNGIKHTVTYHSVGKAVVSVTDRLPSLAHGVTDAGASSAKTGAHIGVAVALNEELRGWEFCPFCQFFAHFSTFTKIPQVPSFQASLSIILYLFALGIYNF